MPTPKPGKEIERGNPGQRNPETDYGLQFGSNGGMTRTGSPTTRAPQSRDQATALQTTQDLPRIAVTISYTSSTMQKLSSIPGNSAHMMVLDPETRPWAEINDHTYLVVLTAGEKVGVMQMSSQEAIDASDSLKDLLVLAINMGLPQTPNRRIDNEANVHATIVGGRKTDPLILYNTLQENIGVSQITRLAGDNVAVTQDGQLVLVTDVPQDQLTPPAEDKSTPPVIASGPRYRRGL